MKIYDSVYGEVEVLEPVILELIESDPLQRLKDVNQAGTQLVFPHIKTTRFDHCVGVMLLLKIKRASLEEQIAGLLHDVPHTAFSHAIDFVFDQGHTQGYHEKFLKKIVFNSEIPKILRSYGIDPEKITDEHNFPLLEQPLPKLCADRIDYTLRDLLSDGVISQKQAQTLLEDIIVYGERFVMKNKKVAREFALKYLDQNRNSWISAKTLATFKLMADMIKLALKKGIISESDLFSTDTYLLSRLEDSKDSEVSEILSRLNPDLKILEDELNFEFHVKGKVRYIDPPVFVNSEARPLSEFDKAFSAKLQKYKEAMTQGRYIKILKLV